MQTISINFIVPQGWHELSDKQLRYVYQLLANEFATDEVKTLCLLQWSGTKVIGRQESGSYLLKKGKFLFEVTPLTLAELLPHLDWLGSIPTVPVRISKINRQHALPAQMDSEKEKQSEIRKSGFVRRHTIAQRDFGRTYADYRISGEKGFASRLNRSLD